jgi:mandelate racemase
MSNHLFIEVSAHLLPVTPTAHMLEWMDIAGGLIAEPMAVREGRAEASDRPGNGIVWNPTAIDRRRA